MLNMREKVIFFFIKCCFLIQAVQEALSSVVTVGISVNESIMIVEMIEAAVVRH